MCYCPVKAILIGIGELEKEFTHIGECLSGLTKIDLMKN